MNSKLILLNLIDIFINVEEKNHLNQNFQLKKQATVVKVIKEPEVNY